MVCWFSYTVEDRSLLHYRVTLASMRLVGEVVRGQAVPLMQRAVEVVHWNEGKSLVNATLPAMLGPSQVLVKVKAL